MTQNRTSVKAHGQLLAEGLRALSGGTTTIMGVSDFQIAGDRDRTIGEIRQVLIDCNRVFLYDGSIVFESRSSRDGNRLKTLMISDRLLQSAPAHVAQVLHGAVAGKDDLATIQIPKNVLSEVFVNEETLDKLPRIEYYSRRPVFNGDFQIRGPGYWPEDGLLIHGNAVEPILWTPPQAECAVDRLPPGLKGFLEDFCFESDADLANVVGMLLTGILANRFIEGGKPAILVNGNQKNIGKTLLANAMGLVLDGADPPKINHSNDEDELGKRLGAKLKLSQRFSMLLFDNRKEKIGNGLLESMVLAPRVSVRLLGHNEDISRVNDFLWLFTMNNAQATTDMMSRSILIHLRFEGEPGSRFRGTNKEEESLKTLVRETREKILGELFGMVVRWRDAGKPPGPQHHRCKRWAEVIGGILAVAGLPEFLRNHDAAALAIDDVLQDLICLAEHTVGSSRQGFFVVGSFDDASLGKSSVEWIPIFNTARISADFDHAKNDRAKSIFIGKFFGARLNRAVPIEIEDRGGTATLRSRNGRGRQRHYWFEVAWDDAVANTNTTGEVAVSPTQSSGGLEVVAPTTGVLTPPPSLRPGPAATGNAMAWEE